MNNETNIHSIYDSYVGAMVATEAKRQSANQVYLSLSIALLSAMSTIDGFSTTIGLCLQVIVTAVWVSMISFYRSLAKAKFATILELEKHLSFAAFESEWRQISRAQKLIGLTRLEMVAPLSVLGLCLAVYLEFLE